RRTTGLRQRPRALPARWARSRREWGRRRSTAGTDSARAEMETPVSYAGVEPGAADQAPARQAPPPRLTPSQVMNNFETLERASVLFTLVDPQLRQLARRMRPIELGAGTRVIEENQPGDSLYLIE